MTQSSCKRDTKSKSHPSVKLAPVRVFSCKHPLTQTGIPMVARNASYIGGSGTQNVAMVTKLLSPYFEAQLVESYCKE